GGGLVADEQVLDALVGAAEVGAGLRAVDRVPGGDLRAHAPVVPVDGAAGDHRAHRDAGDLHLPVAVAHVGGVDPAADLVVEPGDAAVAVAELADHDVAALGEGGAGEVAHHDQVLG